MKKTIFVAIIGIAAISPFSVVAGSIDSSAEQVCKISESNDTVEVFNCYLDGNKVKVSLSNDSQNIKANVTVTVEVTYGNSKRSYTGRTLAGPGSTTLEIPIDPKVGYSEPSSVVVTSISGKKCM